MSPVVKIEKAKGAAVENPNEDNLLEVPPTKATLTDFPPGCPVLFTNTNIDPLVISKGIVESVFVDLTPGSYGSTFTRYRSDQRKTPSSPERHSFNGHRTAQCG